VDENYILILDGQEKFLIFVGLSCMAGGCDLF